MQTTFQKRFLIFSIIFFLSIFCLFIYLFILINKNKEYSQIMQEKWQVETTRRENIKLLISSINSIDSEKNSLETHFIKSSDIVPFLDTVEKLAKDVGVKSEIVSVDIPKDNSSLVVETRVLGNFETIYKLILLLENSPYELEFVSVDIKNLNSVDTIVDKNNKISEWTATFKIKLLSFVNK
ncbi:MAG: hypothetical protein UR25_C0003G0112 [Candidatus Nomurabacteria bacterium GW2011_GWE1_32_28]|uniref:Uncharacterized protein n=1 Tax=Candidatus Nomurabacteria bacterium GW2011_GWF1_31_48 TaxID=1618767 RepID=A0A0F9YF71_9BACT|nr:MAG: hypothetical protein UR10_C0003G0112 [Candidatus Nomurabacteria bacterium GW2011_GWF2_30_133]KKP28752.1 MAG: hypothetical protein UR18_C0002G0164 [Candidatus Nomurabacteria bacterium GW2011_GWE2_31_40]KKP30329.1 MAG: hypothetical protein UR19_C0003G0165 [Candidatus Nomurabacteria bacterium GW2011_GWF1_31_48]KKP34856.1 MAG: hypothetical protein UR25_C0003G0112 [Candidatus Nomurabacteria bacterium GW2011_GWE1_32_28]HAS80950.1 hypothetical protein [Candidatus Nomurabacteria bacterium]